MQYYEICSIFKVSDHIYSGELGCLERLSWFRYMRLFMLSIMYVKYILSSWLCDKWVEPSKPQDKADNLIYIRDQLGFYIALICIDIWGR